MNKAQKEFVNNWWDENKEYVGWRCMYTFQTSGQLMKFAEEFAKVDSTPDPEVWLRIGPNGTMSGTKSEAKEWLMHAYKMTPPDEVLEYKKDCMLLTSLYNKFKIKEVEQ